MRRPGREDGGAPSRGHRGAESDDRDDQEDCGDQEDQEGREGEGKDKGKRIELSVSQVAGAGVATLTAATAASYLNVYGTVIGTAVMAVLSTSAAPVIQHWLTRGGEQAKDLAEKAKHPQTRNFVEGPEPAIDPETTAPFESPDDATRTMALPALGQNLPGQTLAHGFGNPADPTDPHDRVPDEATAFLPRVGPEDPGPDQNVREGGRARPKRGLRAVLIPAAVVFALVMLVILAFELFTGRSLTAWTQGQEGSTSPSLLGGHSAPARPDDGDLPAEPEGERAPGERGGDTAPESDPEAPGAPGTTPGDQDPETPERPTEPVRPPGEEPVPEQPEEPAEPGSGGGGQGEDAPGQEVPQGGAQDDPAPTG